MSVVRRLRGGLPALEIPESESCRKNCGGDVPTRASMLPQTFGTMLARTASAVVGRGVIRCRDECERNRPRSRENRFSLFCEGPASNPGGLPVGVTHSKGAVRSSGGEGSTGSAPTLSNAPMLLCITLIAASVLPLGNSIGEKFRTRVGARPRP